jgi:serine/threonine/tyrosine-interacting protein
VLVHGNAGMNRSASVMVAFVMANYGISLKKALAHVKARRFTANPSQWFMLQLMV